MKARKTIYFIFFLTLSSGCAVTVDLGNEINEPLDNDFQKQSLLGILYAQTSTEFTANNIQTFVSRIYQPQCVLIDHNVIEDGICID